VNRASVSVLLGLLLALAVSVSVLLGLLLALAPAFASATASANPAERLAGLPLDPVVYDRARGCLHRAQPGTRALEAWLAANRARGSSWGTESCRRIPVSRARVVEWRKCRRERARERDREARREMECPRPRASWSLHAEGRALDWHLDAANRADRREGQALVRLLLAPDSAGAPHALARRMGLQEIIWNCRAWFAGAEGLRPYSACVDADGEPRPNVDRTLAHRDHLHLGLSWSGARKRTSFWRSG
jgi:hypothetical protein